jgi:hypothetical protein
MTARIAKTAPLGTALSLVLALAAMSLFSIRPVEAG